MTFILTTFIYYNHFYTRYLFLLQKALLVCVAHRTTYTFLYYMDMRDFSVEEEWLRGRNIGIRLESNLPTASAFNCILICKSEAHKLEWLEVLQEAKATVSPVLAKGSHAAEHYFLLHTFPRPTTCDVCDLLLWGILNQGYQCTACNIKVHGSCLRKLAANQRCRERRPTMQVQRNHAQEVGYRTAAPLPPMPRKTMGRAPAHEPTFLQETVLEEPPPPPPPRPSLEVEVAVAKHTYCNHKDRRDGDLDFTKGDRITILEKIDQHWLRGRAVDGREGIVPAYFVDIITPDSCTSPVKSSQAVLLLGGNGGGGSGDLDRESSDEEADGGAAAAHDYEDPVRETWFAGTMSRDDAQHILGSAADGSYLVRASNQPELTHRFTLSVCFNGITKHVKIIEQPAQGIVYISRSKPFATVLELVHYYQEHSLACHFPTMPTVLRVPAGNQGFAC